MELINLPNIGPTLAEQLRQVGIEDSESLRETGSRDAWLAIQRIDRSACYNRLCALEGAIAGIPKKELASDVKEKLKSFYEEHRVPWKE